MMIELNYRICIFENMGVLASKPCPLYDVVLRAPLLKFLEIITDYIVYINETQWSMKHMVFPHILIHIACLD